MTRLRYVQLFAVGVICAWTSQARGQAWVAPENSLDLDFGYQYVSNDGHYGGGLEGSYELQAEGLDASKNHSVRFGADYSTPVKGLAVGANVTLVNSTFTGNLTYLPHGELHTCVGMPPDQMCNHGEGGTKVTDLNTDVRYQLPFAPGQLAITPTVGATIPLTDYPTIGHAAYGKHLWEVRAGLEVGRMFFDKLFVDALYTYTISEKVDECVIAPPSSPIAGMCIPGTQEYVSGLSLNRSDGRLLTGYFILPQLSVFAAGIWRHTHGGFTWGDVQAILAKVRAGEPLTPEERAKVVFHDQIGRERMLMLGGGLNYQPIDQVGVQTGIYKAVWGDSIANSLAAGVNLTWTAF